MNPSYRIVISTQSSVLMNWPPLVVCCNSWYHFSRLIFLFILISLSFILTCNVCMYYPIYLSITLSSLPFHETYFSLTFFLIFKILTYVTLLSFIVIVSFFPFVWISGTLYQRLENGSRGAIIDKLYSAYLKVTFLLLSFSQLDCIDALLSLYDKALIIHLSLFLSYFLSFFLSSTPSYCL